MNTKAAQYLDMTDSGVEWLGAVPEHWTIERLHRSVQGCFSGVWGDDPNGRDDLVCVRVADFDRERWQVRLTEPTVRAIVPAERNHRLLKDGDLLLEKSGGGDLQPVGVVVKYDHNAEAVCSNFIARMGVAPQYDSNFLVYLHSHLYAIRLNVRSIKQTTGIQNLDSSSYLREQVAFPPLSEQVVIARFLGNMDEKIQCHIRTQQKLVQLLKEHKCAIINHAVIRGLDPTVRLKHSGIKWLGYMPAHWSVRRLRNTSLMRVSNVDKHKRDDEQPVRLCNYVDVYSNDRIHSELNFMHATATRDEIERFRLRCGDVLITKDSETWNDIGVPALVEDSRDDLLCGYHLALIRPSPKHLNSVYLFRTLQSVQVSRQFHVAANGVTRFGLSRNAVNSVYIPVPPVAEQVAIASFLDRANSDIDEAIKSAQQEIALLGEYRTRLIADVVTGKLDVREAVNYTKEEFDEPSTADIEANRRHSPADIGSEVPETES